MSEEKKTFELNDEQLEQVIGGKEQPKGDQSEGVYIKSDGACGQWVEVNTNNKSEYGICNSYKQTNPKCAVCIYRGIYDRHATNDENDSGK